MAAPDRMRTVTVPHVRKLVVDIGVAVGAALVATAILALAGALSEVWSWVAVAACGLVAFGVAAWAGRSTPEQRRATSVANNVRARGKIVVTDLDVPTDSEVANQLRSKSDVTVKGVKAGKKRPTA